jgi:MoaA/NifB/PqqE/SkfB family radical SAM enzyme
MKKRGNPVFQNVTPYSKLQDKRKYLRDIIPLNMPFTLYIDPTNHCNYKCVYCARNLPEFKKYTGKLCHMDMALFEKIADELKTWGRIKSLKFYFIGEPFLNPNFLSMLEKAINYK